MYPRAEIKKDMLRHNIQTKNYSFHVELHLNSKNKFKKSSSAFLTALL